MRSVTIITLAFLIASYGLKAQQLVIESKAGFTISSTLAFPLGKTETNKGAFVFPSLLSNFKLGYGISADYNQQLTPRLNVGVSYSNSIFSNWQFNPSSEAFNNAEATIHSLSMNAIIKNLFRERGILNKGKLYAGISPGVYFVSVKAPQQSVASTKSVRPGVLVNIGFDYAITNKVALSIGSRYQIVSVKSSMYQEERFQWYQLNFGINLRLNRNLNYLRSTYD